MALAGGILYNKETRSSYEIEKETAQMLERQRLVVLQNTIVDPGFWERIFRGQVEPH